MVTLEEAKKRSKELHDSVSPVLRQLELPEALEDLGEVQIAGSYLYDLMVKPDIDFRVYTDSPNLDLLASKAESYISRQDIVGVHVLNFIDTEPTGENPRGLYFGISSVIEGRWWKIDVWVVQSGESDHRFPPGWHEKLTQQQRDAILFLKFNLLEQKRYGRKEGFSSADIYRAVLDGVTSIHDLENWQERLSER